MRRLEFAVVEEIPEVLVYSVTALRQGVSENLFNTDPSSAV